MTERRLGLPGHKIIGDAYTPAIGASKGSAGLVVAGSGKVQRKAGAEPDPAAEAQAHQMLLADA
jgi:hypothetical protein